MGEEEEVDGVREHLVEVLLASGARSRDPGTRQVAGRAWALL